MVFNKLQAEEKLIKNIYFSVTTQCVFNVGVQKQVFAQIVGCIKTCFYTPFKKIG
jgi:hypothetical protein